MSKHAASSCENYSDKLISQKETQTFVDKTLVSFVCLFVVFFIKTKHKNKHRRLATVIVWVDQITRQILGLKTTGVMHVFKRTINWIPTEPVQATFHSVSLGYGGDLVCSEILARALLCVIMYFDKKRTRCISFCRGVLSCIFGIRQYYYYKHVYPSCEFAGVRWLLSTNTLSRFDSTCWFPTMLFRLS